MQYKNNKKIIIDQRKLEFLFRLGCPDKQIIELLKTGDFTSTGDNLIDETLESLLDFKVFENWGGARKKSGRKAQKTNKNNHLENQDENQDENHLENQDDGQVVDKDIDKDIYINNIFNNNIYKQGNKRFTKPTLEQVKQYCIERNNNVDCDRFVNYYESNGWKVGKSPMKDWKAAVRNWERSSFNQPAQNNDFHGI